MKKVVLAYSGGLDTSFCVKYLTKELGYEVYTALANTGGFSAEELKAVEERAYALGAKQHVNIDVTSDYYGKCIKYMVMGNVLRNKTYPISVSSERTFQALAIVAYANSIGADAIAHGSTGAGKTTLVDLILRTYNVPDGTIFIDGHDVNTVPIRQVRAASAYVPQDNFLFSDTIANNISFGVDDADREHIENAAKLSDVHGNIVDFQLGYETVLGERGVTVSGGQKQRISIARALMKQAPILILDDSVSAVDTKTEKIILENLRNTRAGHTTILIAHRISTIEKMDKILFIDDGRLVAVGAHEELYETCPDYRRMVDLQKLEDEGGVA